METKRDFLIKCNLKKTTSLKTPVSILRKKYINFLLDIFKLVELGLLKIDCNNSFYYKDEKIFIWPHKDTYIFSFDGKWLIPTKNINKYNKFIDEIILLGSK